MRTHLGIGLKCTCFPRSARVVPLTPGPCPGTKGLKIEGEGIPTHGAGVDFWVLPLYHTRTPPLTSRLLWVYHLASCVTMCESQAPWHARQGLSLRLSGFGSPIWYLGSAIHTMGQGSGLNAKEETGRATAFLALCLLTAGGM